MSKIDDAIAAVRDRSSMQWMFYDPDEADDVEKVEVRLDGSSEQANSFTPPDGWLLHRIQWGDTFFIRRQQPMRESMIEEMLCDMFRFADQHQMRFHSWETGPDLASDGFHP